MTLHHICLKIGQRFWIFEKRGRHERMFGPFTRHEYNPFLETRRERFR